MIRVTLLAALTALSFGAFASWVEYGDTNTQIHFIDFTTIRKDGDTRTFWTMINNKKRDKDGSMSERHKQIINCKSETYAILQFTAFTQVNLGGSVTLQITHPPKWTHVPPRTAVAELMRLVCSR